LPAIIITARPNQRFAALAAGAGALMEKPLDLQKLVPTIRNLLDEPDSVRIARMGGRPAEFHYVPPTMHESDEDTKPWRNL
jgi:DNA-binding response OmpR family regulator